MACLGVAAGARLFGDASRHVARLANSAVKVHTETDRMVTETVNAAEAKLPATGRKSNKKHRVARKAVLLEKPWHLARKGNGAVDTHGLTAFTIRPRKCEGAAPPNKPDLRTIMEDDENEE